MTKALLTNLILLLLILVLGLVIWLDPFTEPVPQPQALTPIDPNTVNRIALSRGGQQQFALEKHELDGESVWYLTEPIEMPANPVKVSQILDLLTTDSLRQYEIESDILAKLGLDPPGWEIALDQTIVQFGKTEPLEQRRYVRVGAKVHLINDRFSQYNFGSPLMLANLDILPVDKSVTEVHLPDKVIKKVDGQWQSTPSTDAISQSSYNEFIDEWRYAQAQRVTLADQQEQTTTATPVTIYLEKASQPVRLTVESTEQDVIVTNRDWGVRYYLASTIGKRLLQVAPSTNK
ncbi:MAG: hypothetical protein AMJ55_08485 [Gammaproteobacteria bacterium SG8_15]|nr:MAG: hypothetical protein AMJ55_08485 [Gammaproteobacteria bacterium SG8_15]